MARLVHRCPGRLRFRLSAFRDPSLDTRYVRAYLESVDGVGHVRLNPAAHSAIVTYDPARTSEAAIHGAIAALEGTALPRVADTATLGRETDISPLVWGAGLCAVIGLVPRPLAYALTVGHISETLRKGVSALLTEGVRTETLDALAVGVAAARGELMTANVTQWLLNLAGLVENSTRRASDDLVMRLLKPAAESAWIETDDGQGAVEIPFADLRAGMHVCVHAGDTIPVDGRVLKGLATVNQSSVTGESLPIPKEAGDDVLSGSLVEDGNLTIIAERVGDATATARISRFLRDALAQETATQSKAQEIAEKRISITLGLALAVLVTTRSLRRMESVLLIDFACASKLGTSVAIKSAMARAAEHGGLVKGGRALEKLARADTVVFDKTGTLTHNELHVTDVVCLNETCETENALLALVASIAEHSTHPVAAAVVAAATSQGLRHMSHEEVAFMVGHGLAANAGDRSVRIGSRHYLEAHEGISFARFEKKIESLGGHGGKSLLFVGVDGKPFGVIALRDQVRAEAEKVLSDLRADGIRYIVVISGDTEGSVRSLGADLDLDEVHATVAPENKAAIIADLQARGRNVAYIGDGVNDAPALMAADVGIAMPRGADVARATADIILTSDSLDGIATTRRLAVDTLRLIDSNFTIAVGVNGALLAGAALGRIPPVASAVFHNGTTLAILARSLAGGRVSRRGLITAVKAMEQAALETDRAD